MVATGGGIQDTLGCANELYQVLENGVMPVLGADSHHKVLRTADNELHDVGRNFSNLLVL